MRQQMEAGLNQDGAVWTGGYVAADPQSAPAMPIRAFQLPTPGGTAKDDALNRLSVLMSVFDDMCPREREAALAYLTGYASTDYVSNS